MLKARFYAEINRAPNLASFSSGLMAGGETLQPCPPHEDEVKAKTSLSNSSYPQIAISLNNSQNRPLEDGEISPTTRPDRPSSSLKKPLNQIHQFSYSQIVQGHKEAPPVSKPASVVPICNQGKPTVLFPISVDNGKPAVLIPMSEKRALVDNLQFVLIGKFSHGRPPMGVIKQFLIGLKLRGSCRSSSYDAKHIFIEDDFYRIWLKLKWNIAGFAMQVFKWSHEFCPAKESPIAPVWIRVEGLPLYLFDKISLLSVSNAIGKPISVDPRNVSRSMLNSARICVELDVSKPLLDAISINVIDDVSKVLLEQFWVKVYYDELPVLCAFCCHIGHDVGVCKRRCAVDCASMVPVQGTVGPSHADQTSNEKAKPETAAIGAKARVQVSELSDLIVDITDSSAVNLQTGITEPAGTSAPPDCIIVAAVADHGIGAADVQQRDFTINTAAQQQRENGATRDLSSTSTDFQSGSEIITVLGSAETTEVKDGTTASVVSHNAATEVLLKQPIEQASATEAQAEQSEKGGPQYPTVIVNRLAQGSEAAEAGAVLPTRQIEDLGNISLGSRLQKKVIILLR